MKLKEQEETEGLNLKDAKKKAKKERRAKNCLKENNKNY